MPEILSANEIRERLSKDLLSAVRSAAAKVHAGRAVHGVLRAHGDEIAAGELVFHADDFSRVVVLGAGKAVVPMARAAMDILGDRVEQAIVAAPAGYFEEERPADGRLFSGVSLKSRLVVLHGEHPVPLEGSFAAAARICDVARSVADKRTLVFFLLCGGASAPFASPLPPLASDEKSRIVGALVRSEATIGEINCVRRHISRVKGGRFLKLLRPAAVCTIAISDVPGNAEHDIGSGPTVPDPTTCEDALGVLDGPARDVLDPSLASAAKAALAETHKPDDPIFAGSSFLIAADNAAAKSAAAEHLRSLGYTTRMLLDEITCEVEEAARLLWEEWNHWLAESGGGRIALVAGGETVVRLSAGGGRGGRNHELALRMALRMDGATPPMAFVAFGTDGLDGASGAAGAIARTDSIRRAAAMGADASTAILQNNSGPFFAAEGGQIPRMRTDTNVMDLMIFVSQQLERETAPMRRRPEGNQ